MSAPSCFALSGTTFCRPWSNATLQSVSPPASSVSLTSLSEFEAYLAARADASPGCGCLS